MLPFNIIQKYKLKPKKDVYGMELRLNIIKYVCDKYDIKLNNMIDLGGNSGFFSMSLIKNMYATHSIIIDMDNDIIKYGLKIRNEMNLYDEIFFENKIINLESIRMLNIVDTIICMNVLHHAGVIFDQYIVEQISWKKYIILFLDILFSKCKIIILCLNFFQNRMMFENNYYITPDIFLKILLENNIDFLYHGNIQYAKQYGIDKLNTFNISKINHFLKFYNSYNNDNILNNYYMYIIKRKKK